MLEPTALYGGNADYLEALYEQYLRDPASLEPKWREYFASIAPAAAGVTGHYAHLGRDFAERAQLP